MPSTTIANQIIPGYDLVSGPEQTAFLCSKSGALFKQITDNYSLFLAQLNSTSWFSRFFSSNPKDKETLIQDELQRQQKELLSVISKTEEYKELTSRIILHCLETEIDELRFLTPAQRHLLCEAEFSKKLLETLVTIDWQIEQVTNEMDQVDIFSSLLWGKTTQLKTRINTLKEERAEAISFWRAAFLNDPSMVLFRKTIEEQKELIRQQQLESKRAALRQHVKQLSDFFPLLHYRKSDAEEPIITQILRNYSTANGDDVVANPGKVDEEQLTDLLHYCMQQMSQAEITFMNLDGFNKKHAREMAVEILKAFDKKNTLDWEKWFSEYEKELHEHIIKQLQLVNGKPWEMKPHVTQDIVESLSFLWRNPLTERANQFFSKMADAHGFIQATSFSTQNESSFLAILDMYNYARHHEQISEIRAILTSLLSPLQPLYDEYKDIALYEKNVYMKAFRAMMPIVIVVAVIIIIFALTALIFSPLVLPELAFTAAFVPALFAGLGVSTQYVSSKNSVYKSIRDWYYGGSFEIPEFQVNQRMCKTFGEDKAHQVRAFYIEELQKCDAIELSMSEKYAQGVLSKEEIELREANTKKRYQLNLEWYDIHSNNGLDYQHASVIFAERLHAYSDEQYKELQKSVEEESESIRHCVAEVTGDLKKAIAENAQQSDDIRFVKSPSTPSSKASSKVPSKAPSHAMEEYSQESAPFGNNSEEKGGAPIIKSSYRYGLFTPPQSLQVKKRLEHYANFSSQLNCAPA